MRVIVLLSDRAELSPERRDALLAESRRRILAGVTEPGAAPVGAPHPTYQENER